MNNVIPFKRRVNVSDWPMPKIRQYAVDNGWTNYRFVISGELSDSDCALYMERQPDNMGKPDENR